jgi:hypothetical protein
MAASIDRERGPLPRSLAIKKRRSNQRRACPAFAYPTVITASSDSIITVAISCSDAIGWVRQRTTLRLHKKDDIDGKADRNKHDHDARPVVLDTSRREDALGEQKEEPEENTGEGHPP